MLRASIYNPALGGENNIEKQLIFHYGEESTDEQLKSIGVAQGLAELANSFDKNPLQWVRTKTELMVLLKVEESADDENWRHGFWIFATVSLDEFLYFVCYSIRDAYNQFRLLEGSFAWCLENNINYKDWWTKFFKEWSPGYSLGATGAPGYLRLVSGVLSPDTVNEIEDLRKKTECEDIFVCSTVDAAFFWPGKYLEHDVRVSIQAWLATTAPEKHWVDSESTKSDTSSKGGHKDSTVRDKSRTPEPEGSTSPKTSPQPIPSGPSVSPQSSQELLGDQTQEDIGALSTVIGESDETSGFFASVSAYIPSMSYMNIGNLPTMPSSAALKAGVTSMTSMPSVNFRRIGASMGQYFQSNPAATEVERISRIIHQTTIKVNDTIHYLHAFQKNSVIFCFISKHNMDWSSETQHVCECLTREIEGVSFALDPPNQFGYMAINAKSRTLTTTIPPPSNIEDYLAHEVMTRLYERPSDVEQQTMRSSSNWWMNRTVANDSLTFIFCKKLEDSDVSDLLGLFNRSTGDWVESYVRRRGL